MPQIENYTGDSRLGPVTLAAYLSGDVEAVEEGLNRMSRHDLNELHEALEDLLDRVSVRLPEED